MNRARKSRLRHSVRALRRAIDAKDAAAAQTLLPQTFSVIDRASKWGIIKKNTAARFKSRISLRIKALVAA